MTPGEIHSIVGLLIFMGVLTLIGTVDILRSRRRPRPR